MKQIHLLIYSMAILMFSCSTVESQPTRWLEDIVFNPDLDNKKFELCFGDESTIQYYRVSNNTGSKSFKREFLKMINEQYNYSKAKKESGLLRIRFMVNCKGEADRFRVLGSTLNYSKKEFDKSIIDQLLSIVKSVDNWNASDLESEKDYYHYVLFKIIDGEINKVLP